MKKFVVFSLLCAATSFYSFSAVPTKAQANEIVNNIKSKYAPDKRQIVYDITPHSVSNGQIALTGKISEKSVYEQLISAFKDDSLEIIDLIEVLPTDKWAQPRISVACIRVNPSHAAEMATQAIMGQPLRVLEKNDDGWTRVQTPDGYIGWVTGSSLTYKSDDDMKIWRNADRLIVKNPYQTRIWLNEKTNNLREVVSDVVNGNIVEGKYNPKKARLEVKLPDGRTGWINTADVEPIEKWAAQTFDADKILDIAYSMEGTPYLWGGTSVKSLDCSGLAKVSYLSNGIILMRDASQQALTGTRLNPEDWKTFEAGDLLFFGNPDTGRVTHVAIYDNAGNYVHSSGRVKRNSIDPESPDYLSTPFLHAVRIHGNEGTFGITPVSEHEWYFDKKKD